MSDIFSSEKRKQIMRSVKGRDTAPEKRIRNFLHAQGYRYVLCDKYLPGKPDIVFSKKRKIIFVNGCFWHGHNCKRGSRIPKTNTKYWKKKISTNVERDKKNLKELKKLGWKVKTLWECNISDKKKVSKALTNFLGPPKSI